MNDQIEIGTDIALIEIPAETALATFSGKFETQIEPLLRPIKRAVEAYQKNPPSVATEEGRQEIKSFAHKLAKSKGALEAAGKRVADEVKRLPKIVDANRRQAWDLIEGWQKEIRKPLDDYEAAEQARKDAHLERIEELRHLSTIDPVWSPQTIQDRIDRLDVVFNWTAKEEFEEEYRIAHSDALGRLRTALEAAEAREAQEAELAALRAAQASRDALDRELRDRAIRETREREEKHQAEMAEAKRQLDEAAELVRQSDARAKQAIEDAARAVLEAKQAEDARAAEAAAMERQRIADKERADAEEAERKAAAERAEKARAAQRARWVEIKTQIIEAFKDRLTGPIAGGPAKKVAVIIVDAIDAGQIPYVQIVLDDGR